MRLDVRFIDQIFPFLEAQTNTHQHDPGPPPLPPAPDSTYKSPLADAAFAVQQTLHKEDSTRPHVLAGQILQQTPQLQDIISDPTVYLDFIRHRFPLNKHNIPITAEELRQLPDPSSTEEAITGPLGPDAIEALLEEFSAFVYHGVMKLIHKSQVPHGKEYNGFRPEYFGKSKEIQPATTYEPKRDGYIKVWRKSSTSTTTNVLHLPSHTIL